MNAGPKEEVKREGERVAGHGGRLNHDVAFLPSPNMNGRYLHHSGRRTFGLGGSAEPGVKDRPKAFPRTNSQEYLCIVFREKPHRNQ